MLSDVERRARQAAHNGPDQDLSWTTVKLRHKVLASQPSYMPPWHHSTIFKETEPSNLALGSDGPDQDLSWIAMKLRHKVLVHPYGTKYIPPDH